METGETRFRRRRTQARPTPVGLRSHVVGRGGVGDGGGGGGGVEAVLAAQAAAVAAEAVHVGQVGVLGAPPPGPGVEGVLLVHVVVVSLSAEGGKSDLIGSRICSAQQGRGWRGGGTHSLAGDLSPGPRDGAQHDGEGTGREGGEEAEVQRPFHAVVAHAHHGVQVVLQRSKTEAEARVRPEETH